MFGRRITLFRIFGFEVRIDLSWIVIAALVTWSAGDILRKELPGLSPSTYLVMGLAGMVGLFGSIVFHELSHSLMARRRGMVMSGITLFIFGGVAEMTDEPPDARSEFLMAIVGPLSSLLLAGAFQMLARLGESAGWSPPVTAVLGYLGLLNVGLAVFNLIPGFPLDGGRVLRALLWGWKHDLYWATRRASQIGTFFGYALIALGLIVVVSGSAVGLWWCLIGLFLRNAAINSYRQVVVRRALQAATVRRFMHPHPTTVPAEITLDELVERYFFRYFHKIFPVVRNGGELRGCVTPQLVQQVPREEWSQRRVEDIVQPCSPQNSIHPDTDAMTALRLMSRNRATRLLVLEGDRLVGILTLKDLLDFLSLRTNPSP